MNNPKISVMFMSYNHGLYIQRAMDSVLNQTFQDFEVILSDDCSTDNTKDIISKLQDKRLKLHFFDINQGATINNRYIWEHSVGEYLALINSDDVWLPDHLEKSISYLDTHKECGAVFSWADLIDEDDNVIDPCCEVFKQPNRTQAEWLHYLFTKGNCLCHPSMVIRREVYDVIGFYKLGFRQLPDYNMWTRVIKKYNFHILQEILVHHRRCIRTSQNTSAPIITNSIRDINEALYTLLHYFDGISDTLFQKAFSREFRNKLASEKKELFCEKFFLMYDEKYYMTPICKFASFLYLQDIYDKDGICELLKSQYNFTLADVHELGTVQDLLALKNGSSENHLSFWSKFKKLIHCSGQEVRNG